MLIYLFFICSQSPGHPFLKILCHPLPSEKKNFQHKRGRILLTCTNQVINIEENNKQLKINTIRIITKSVMSPLEIGHEQTMRMMVKEG